jgi:hypothetical protein
MVSDAAERIGVKPGRIISWIHLPKPRIAFKVVNRGKLQFYAIPEEEAERMGRVFRGKKTVEEMVDEVNGLYPDTISKSGLRAWLVRGVIAPGFKQKLALDPRGEYLFSEGDRAKVRAYVRNRRLIEENTHSTSDIASAVDEKVRPSEVRVKRWVRTAKKLGLPVYTLEQDHIRIPTWASPHLVRALNEGPANRWRGGQEKALSEAVGLAIREHERHELRPKLDAAQKALDRAYASPTYVSRDRSRKFTQEEVNAKLGLPGGQTPAFLSAVNSLRKHEHKVELFKAAKLVLQAANGNSVEIFARVFTSIYGNDAEKAKPFFGLLRKASQGKAEDRLHRITAVFSHFATNPENISRVLEENGHLKFDAILKKAREKLEEDRVH